MKTKFCSVLTAVLMVIAVFVFTLSPVGAAAATKTGSITLHVVDSTTGKPLSGTTFRLYQVANAYQSGKNVRYEFIPPYEEANISIDNLQDSYLPVHLTHFAVVRALPYTLETANKNGWVVFDNLKPGLYLVVPWGDFDGYFMPSPFVINIPEFDDESQEWEYDINATPKIFINSGYTDGTYTYISVKKVWDTNEPHPQKVTVVLLKDLEEFARVELNKDNNWYYRWDALEKNSVWNVVEEAVPDGYNVTYETSSNTVTIINKPDSGEEETTTNPSGDEPGTTPGHHPTTNPGDEPGTTPGHHPTTNPGNEPGTTPGSESSSTPGSESGSNSGSESGSNPGSESGTNHGSENGTTEPDTLIDTGQLNWPVPVFATAGLFVFSIGWAILNFSKKETE